METQDSTLSTMSHTALQGKLTESATSFISLFSHDKDRLQATADKLRELAVGLHMCPKPQTGRELPGLCVAVGGAVLGAGIGALTGAMGGACGGVVAVACDRMLDDVDAVGAIQGVFGSVIGGVAGGTAVGAASGVIGGALIASGGSLEWYHNTEIGVVVWSAAGFVTGLEVGAIFGDAVGAFGGALGGALGALCGAYLATGAIRAVAAPIDLRPGAAEASHVVDAKAVAIVREFQETSHPLVKELEVIKEICGLLPPSASVQAVARSSRNALAAVHSMKRTLAHTTGSTAKQDTLVAARFETSARQCKQTIKELEKTREELGNFLASIKSPI